MNYSEENASYKKYSSTLTNVSKSDMEQSDTTESPVIDSNLEMHDKSLYVSKSLLIELEN